MAEKLVEDSKSLFEENPIYHLAESWVFLYSDSRLAEKAFYAFEELATNSSSLSDNNNPDTLSNLVISSSLNEKETYSQTLNQLQEQHPNYSFLVDMKEKGALFDSLCQDFMKNKA
ncbi:hypothetical protein BB561_005234 [Smittium simulii]|uniref:Coatomer subunit epsilon n=1 Tax=Smittium simulii TaxID=133385 RepID=A0A2T9YBE9_9FUNG|nr:hypothetical protein BB561_005234 [Smittium simulii]